MAEVVRPVRFLNVIVGAGVAMAPFLFDGATLAGTIGHVVVALALIGLSLLRGTRSTVHYGRWDRLIVFTDSHPTATPLKSSYYCDSRMSPYSFKKKQAQDLY